MGRVGGGWAVKGSRAPLNQGLDGHPPAPSPPVAAHFYTTRYEVCGGLPAGSRAAALPCCCSRKHLLQNRHFAALAARSLIYTTRYEVCGGLPATACASHSTRKQQQAPAVARESSVFERPLGVVWRGSWGRNCSRMTSKVQSSGPSSQPSVIDRSRYLHYSRA